MTTKDNFAVAYMAAYVTGQLTAQAATLGDHDPHKAIASRAYDMAEALYEEKRRREEEALREAVA